MESAKSKISKDISIIALVIVIIVIIIITISIYMIISLLSSLVDANSINNASTIDCSLWKQSRMKNNIT